jgi:hypothetical protein
MSTRTILAFSTAVAVVFAAGAYTPAFAQEKPQTQPQQKQQQQKVTSPVMGDLVSVDTDARTITVRAQGGQTLQFSYTDKTEVSGAQKTVQGLATMKDARVTVHFTESGARREATRIIVQQ